MANRALLPLALVTMLLLTTTFCRLAPPSIVPSQELMALFTAQHREMLAAVSSATGGLESRLSELEAESVANRTVKASISAGISAAISGEASTAEERAFERMRQAAKGSLLSGAEGGTQIS
jgi:hypothetical protein